MKKPKNSCIYQKRQQFQLKTESKHLAKQTKKLSKNSNWKDCRHNKDFKNIQILNYRDFKKNILK